MGAPTQKVGRCPTTAQRGSDQAFPAAPVPIRTVLASGWRRGARRGVGPVSSVGGNHPAVRGGARSGGNGSRHHPRRPRWARCSTRPVRRYGEGFAAVLDTAQVWRNGEPARRERRRGRRRRGGGAAPGVGWLRSPGPGRGPSPAADGPRRRRGSIRQPARSGGRPAAPVGLTRSLADGLVGGYDIDGPRIRLGLLWFVVLLVAIALGPWPLAVVMAVVAGAAGVADRGGLAPRRGGRQRGRWPG